MDERVAKGVALLDELEPGWYDSIDLEQFDINDPCLCVLGQLRGDYYKAIRELDISQESRLREQNLESEKYGFTAGAKGRSEWDLLEDQWRRVIVERQTAVA